MKIPTTRVLVSHSLELQHGEKNVSLGSWGTWVTIKDKTNGLLIVEIWWTDKCGSKKCLHTPGKTLLLLGTLLQKLIGSSLETTSLYKKHISTGPGITSCGDHVTVSRSAWNSMAQFVADNGNALTPDGQIHRRNLVSLSDLAVRSWSSTISGS